MSPEMPLKSEFQVEKLQELCNHDFVIQSSSSHHQHRGKAGHHVVCQPPTLFHEKSRTDSIVQRVPVVSALFHVQTITYRAVMCGCGLTMLATTTDASISLLRLTGGTFIPRSQFRLRKSMERTINISESATPEKSSNQREGGGLPDSM